MNNKHHPWFILEGFLRMPASVLGGILLAMVILLVLSQSPADVQATSVMPQPHSQATTLLSNTVYLPLVLNNYSTHVLPILIAPQNSAVLDTLIPLFQWDMGSQPTNTSSCLAFSTSPNPTGCNASGFGSSGPKQVVAWYNLQPSTTYYWRVGAVYNYDYSNKYWSEQWSFTTGTTGGTILPSPTLISPANGSSISPNNLILNWNAVTGAVEYSITLHDIDLDDWYGFDESTAPADLSWFTLNPSTHYEWYVEARNNYAWGPSSATWQFTTISGSASPTSTESTIDVRLVNPDGTQVNVIR